LRISLLAISFGKIRQVNKIRNKVTLVEKILLPPGHRCEFVERLDCLFFGHPLPSALDIIPMMKVQDQSCNMKLFIRNVIYVVSSKCSWYHSISKKYVQKQYNNLNHISFKIVPLCNCTLLPATVKVLETFLEDILWKPFQLFRRILNDISNTTKAPSL